MYYLVAALACALALVLGNGMRGPFGFTADVSATGAAGVGSEVPSASSPFFASSSVSSGSVISNFLVGGPPRTSAPTIVHPNRTAEDVGPYHSSGASSGASSGISFEGRTVISWKAAFW